MTSANVAGREYNTFSKEEVDLAMDEMADWEPESHHRAKRSRKKEQDLKSKKLQDDLDEVINYNGKFLLAGKILKNEAKEEKARSTALTTELQEAKARYTAEIARSNAEITRLEQQLSQQPRRSIRDIPERERNIVTISEVEKEDFLQRLSLAREDYLEQKAAAKDAKDYFQYLRTTASNYVCNKKKNWIKIMQKWSKVMQN